MTELIILDVDGCMTDGKIIYSEDGNETKAFNVKDGLAIKTWIRMGKQVAIITGRRSKIVSRRAEELEIVHLYQGVKQKAEQVEKLAAELNIDTRNIAAIGDDLNDYGMLSLVGTAYVPSNASDYVKDIADVVLDRAGGEGAVREMIERVVRSNGEEEAFLAFWQ